MTQTAILTEWKFVVEFEDEESREISGIIGKADTLEECEGAIEDEIQYQVSQGRTLVNAEAVELCAVCEGEGKIRAGGGGEMICDSCGGHLGSIAILALPDLFRREARPSFQSSSISWVRGEAKVLSLVSCE
jgi:hypothetical protein